MDNLLSVAANNLLGNGAICLVWFSEVDRAGQLCMYYIDFIGVQKPNLLIKAVNNTGAETHIKYAPSTRFYLDDKENGNPWLTRLLFPVQCSERVETLDCINGNHFVTRYVHYEGYYDGIEREFRGFGLVEQWDTEEIGIIGTRINHEAANFSLSSNVLAIYTKTWFHIGVFVNQNTISRHMEHEYYSAASLGSARFEKFAESLLVDSILPSELVTTDEQKEACRALKGQVIRIEIYGCDSNY
jgi:hypothetical protein